MTVYFHFVHNHEFVTGEYGLSGTEILAVRQWQNEVLGYDFSFHTSHEGGWPVYITGRKGKGMSKINLKNAPPVTFIDNGSATKSQVEDAKAVVLANLAAFKKMAKNYYEGVTNDKPTVMLSRCCGAAIAKNKCLKCKKAA